MTIAESISDPLCQSPINQPSRDFSKSVNFYNDETMNLRNLSRDVDSIRSPAPTDTLIL